MNLMQALTYVQLVVGDRWNQLQRKGSEKGLSQTTEVVLWVIGTVVIVGAVYAAYRTWFTTQTDRITGTNPIQ